MSTYDTLDPIKSLAKRLERAQGITHSKALDSIAEHLGQSHWPHLVGAHERGWRPTVEQELELQKLVGDAMAASDTDLTTMAKRALGRGLTFTRWEPSSVPVMDADEIYGTLDGTEFYIGGDEFEIALGALGWEIILDQAPAALPEVRRLGKPVKSVEQLDPAFVERAITLLKTRARRMHAEVLADWPEASTRPDPDGNVQHPLFGGVAKEWHCLHCDAAIAGPKLAANLWHCPDCGATPIDIFPEPFRDDVGQPA